MSTGQGYIINNNGDEVEETALRVFRVLHPILNALTSDFTILGFKKESPNYHLGRKVRSQYTCPTSQDIIIVKTFTDILDDTGTLSQLQVTFDFYNEKGEVGLSKTEIVKKYNKAEAKTEQRKRRSRQIDFLEAGAEGTLIEPYVDAIIHHYATEIQLYKEHGSKDFENAILSEDDIYISSYLQIEVPRLDDPSTKISIKNSILYQLTGVLE